MVAQAKTNSRSNARSAAEGSNSTGSTGGRRPGQRDEETGTDAATQEAAAQPNPPADIPLIVIAPHDKAKRAGTKAFDFYQKYPPVGELTTVRAARFDKDNNELVRGKDITFDVDRRHILVGDDAANFPVDGSAEEKLAYLKGLPKTRAGFTCDDKRMIAWGYMEAPKEEVKEATAQVQAEDAKQTA